MTVLAVAMGGACGASLRFALDRWIQHRHRTAFPWGTITVNSLGSLILGILAGGALVGSYSSHAHSLIGVGFCGALTTYSTFSYETVRLLIDGARWFSLLNVVVTVVLGLSSGVAGMLIGTVVHGP